MRVNRKNCDQFVRQCDLISKLTKYRTEERVRLAVYKSKADTPTKFIAKIRKNVERNIHIYSVAIRWAQRGLTSLSNSAVSAPYIVCKKDKTVEDVVEAVEKMLFLQNKKAP